MARDILWWSKWSPHVGNALTIWGGLPLIMSAFAGVWADLSKPGLSVFLVIVFVFTMALWACIGLVWLRERKRGPTVGQIPDFAYGIVLDGFVFNFDPSNPTYSHALTFEIKNLVDTPIKCEYFNAHIHIANQVSPDANKGPGPTKCILPRKGGVRLYPPGFPPGVLNFGARTMGDFECQIRYGHPDGEFTRILTRKISLEIVENALPFPMLPKTYTVLPLNITEDDRLIDHHKSSN
jgi:hypothetical protein